MSYFFRGPKDISDYKRLQQARHERQVAVEASKAKSAFLASMSHEIRSPMSAVIGMTDMVLNTPLEDDQRQYLQIVMQSSESLLSLLNSILDYSKIEANRLELEKIEFDPLEVIENACETMSIPAHGNNLELIHDVAADVPAVLLGDPTRLGQIVLNLVGNAIKFTRQGGIEVRAWIENSHEEAVGRRWEADSGSILFRVSVSDTGIGIPEEKRETIFDSFSQVDSSTTRKFGGTGLGLAISRQLAELMGGRMWVEPGAGGQGSCFHFFVHLEVKSCAENRIMFTQYTNFNEARFLLLEAHQGAREHARRLLSMCGAEVTAFATGAETLVHLQSWQEGAEPPDYDVAVISLQVADLQRSGLEHALADGVENIGKLILTMSTGYRFDERPDAQRLKAHPTLIKPLKRHVLLQAINKVLGHVSELGDDGRVRKPQDDQTSRLSLHILLADAKRNSRKVAMRALVLDRHQVETAVSGPQVLEKLRRYPIDLLITSVQLPELDGITLTEQIRAGVHEGISSTLPIIGLTGHVGLKKEALQAGMDFFLAKPYRVEQLAELVKEALWRGREQKRMQRADLARKALPKTAGFTPPLGQEPPELLEQRHRFVQDYRMPLEQLQHAAEQQDAAALVSQATWFRDRGVALGAGLLKKAAFGMVMKGRRGDLSGARSSLAELQQQIQHMADHFSDNSA